MVILVYFILIARSIHLKFKMLVKNANELGQGAVTLTIVKNGPQEVERSMAFALGKNSKALNRKRLELTSLI